MKTSNLFIKQTSEPSFGEAKTSNLFNMRTQQPSGSRTKNLTLVKFNDKRDLRLLLRYNHESSIKRSSIYKIGDMSYVLLQSTAEIIFPQNLKITQIPEIGTQMLNTAEEHIFNWAKSEILQAVDFVQFEYKTERYCSSRMVNLGGAEVSRTFEYLPDVFAILNYTSDSFSDGGQYNNIDSALKRAEVHLENKARIIDLGVESTRPGAIKINGEQEVNVLKEVLPHLIELKKQRTFSLSVDTYHTDTVKWLLDQDVDIINDVSGKLSHELVKLITSSNKTYVAMHSLIVPAQKDIVLDESMNPVTHIYQWMENKIRDLKELDIDLQQVILDPGIGFGLTLAQSWNVVRQLEQFKNLPCEIMLGHSRKVFFSYIHNDVPQNRDLDTAVIARDNLHNVDYLRLHDLKIFNQIAELP